MPRSSHRMPRIANTRSSVLSNVARCGPPGSVAPFGLSSNFALSNPRPRLAPTGTFAAVTMTSCVSRSVESTRSAGGPGHIAYDQGGARPSAIRG
ncbi:hypothetical protein AURDEDRAFT_113360 [Auricularia subglabra TFB-10046 SS5]|nr:hypothetical protein AURDEDRAFT_113360 [Auricularia subglabra TFB-10046 SS5]